MKDKKGYKLYNFIIIYLVPIIHLVNLLSSINIAHNLMTQKVIKFNSLLIEKKEMYTLHSIYVSEDEKYVTPSFEIT